MSRSMQAVVAFLILMPGVACGCAAWWLALPATEPLFVGRLGPAGALALWALLGAAVWAGVRVARALGSRAFGARLRCAGGPTAF